MKFRRCLSGLTFGLGCALIFIGILTTVLPSVPNQQLQLVLGSFSHSSDNAIVQMINRTMSLALAQNRRVLVLGILAAAAGACLLLNFTPEKRKPQSLEKEQPVPAPTTAVSEPEIEAAPQAPNPFAVATYLDSLPLRERKTDISFVRHASPILEPNRIEEIPVSVDPALDEDAAKPYFSNRFEAESRAIETERGLPSQSGSSILIRNVFDATPANTVSAVPKDEPAPSAQEAAVSPTAPLSTPTVMPPFSPRIRSTMGRRSSR